MRRRSQFFIKFNSQLRNTCRKTLAGCRRAHVGETPAVCRQPLRSMARCIGAVLSKILLKQRSPMAAPNHFDHVSSQPPAERASSFLNNLAVCPRYRAIQARRFAVPPQNTKLSRFSRLALEIQPRVFGFVTSPSTMKHHTFTILPFSRPAAACRVLHDVSLVKWPESGPKPMTNRGELPSNQGNQPRCGIGMTTRAVDFFAILV